MESISLEVNVHDRLRQHVLDKNNCRAALLEVSRRAGWQQAEFSIAVVGDAEMTRIHTEYLQDETTTDVMSFMLDERWERIEGELIVNGELAARVASAIGWQTEDELLWYIVHGGLHLAGWQDETPAQRQAMFLEQARILQAVGYSPELAARGMAPMDASRVGSHNRTT